MKKKKNIAVVTSDARLVGMLCPLAVQQTYVSERNSQTLLVLISMEKTQKKKIGMNEKQSNKKKE